MPDLNALDIDVVAVSADSESRAVEQIGQVNPTYPVGYDLTIEQMHALCLYISGPKSGMNVGRDVPHSYRTSVPSERQSVGLAHQITKPAPISALSP